MTNDQKTLLVSALTKFLGGLLLMGALLFLPAGGLRFPGGWRLILLLFVPMLLFGIVLYLRAPELLKKRLNSKESSDVQKKVVLLSGLEFIACFVLAGLDFRFGWCRPECNRCAEACPAGAIRKTVRAADKKALRTNLAVWHPERCVAATGKDVCHACERHCPVRAITLVARAGAAADAPKVPQVNADLCMGCGACEHYCPARPRTAMTVEGRA